MKGKKLKKRKIVIFGLAVLIAILNISIYSGNEAKQQMVLVAGEIDKSKTLDEQLENFAVVEVNKNVIDRFGGTVVKNLRELAGKRISEDIEIGSPVLKSLLIDGQGLGQFASETPEGKTIYKLTGAISQLPTGIKKGDKINISLMSQDGKADKRLDLIMRDAKIHTVTETDVYVLVTQNGFDALTMLAEMGTFVLQLPGQKEVPLCAEVEKEAGVGVECYKEGDKAGSVKSSDLLKSVISGEILNDETINIKEPVAEPTVEDTKQAAQTDFVNEPASEEVENRQGVDSKISDYGN